MMAARSERYLLHFAMSHLDMRLPELKALLAVHGLTLEEVLVEEREWEREAEVDVEGKEGTEGKKEAEEGEEEGEGEGLGQNDGHRLLGWRRAHRWMSPFLEVRLPSDEVAEDMARQGVLLRGVYSLWASGRTMEAMLESLGGVLEEKMLEEAMRQRRKRRRRQDTASSPGPGSDPSPEERVVVAGTDGRDAGDACDAELDPVAELAHRTWNVIVTGYGNRLSLDTQHDRIRRVVNTYPDLFRGTIDLDAADMWFRVFEEYHLADVEGWINNFSKLSRASLGAKCASDAIAADRADPRSAAHMVTTKTPQDQLPLTHVYFARELARSGRQHASQKTLKQRVYLGPTSMDSELAAIMSNLGTVRQGTCVLDPFVGTGSILVSCAAVGAQCFGTDIDIRVLRGKEPGRNVFANFDQYGLSHPELVRADASMLLQQFRFANFFDAIVTDPPYGIRAGARRSGSKRAVVKPVVDRATHVPQTKVYDVDDVMYDLLDNAAQCLRVGGRLVYILPVMLATFAVDRDLPSHPALEVVDVGAQLLSRKHARLLVVMQKRCAYEQGMRETARAQQSEQTSASINDLRTKLRNDRQDDAVSSSSSSSSAAASASANASAATAAAAAGASLI